MLLALALNWIKAEGVPKLQETFVSEIGTKHRQANIRALRRFISEAKEKLEPLYHAQVGIMIYIMYSLYIGIYIISINYIIVFILLVYIHRYLLYRYIY
eukprot:COSAG06_NODE_10099_length_1750_cov_1.875227_2_plen_99_part_00